MILPSSLYTADGQVPTYKNLPNLQGRIGELDNCSQIRWIGRFFPGSYRRSTQCFSPVRSLAYSIHLVSNTDIILPLHQLSGSPKLSPSMQLTNFHDFVHRLTTFCPSTTAPTNHPTYFPHPPRHHFNKMSPPLTTTQNIGSLSKSHFHMYFPSSANLESSSPRLPTSTFLSRQKYWLSNTSSPYNSRGNR